MPVSQMVVGYLDKCGADFDVIGHRHTSCSAETARVAHIAARTLAKGVLMHDEHDYVLAVVPASRRVNRWAVEGVLEEPQVFFADESDMPYLFRDCERGAVPVIGPAFGIKTAVDDELLHRRHVYFEAGDHEHLIHMRGRDFAKLMVGQTHGHISY